MILLFVGGICKNGVAQLRYNIPYSIYGLGEMQGSGYANAAGMGGVGMATSSTLFMNTVNPALLQRNRYTNFEMGSQYRFQSVKTQDITQQSADGNIGYFGFSLPVTNSWSTQMGIRPYSRVNYMFQDRTTLSDSEYASHEYEGSGGINAWNFSNGFRILDDTSRRIRLSAGLEIQYLFGSVEESTTTLLYLGEEEPNKKNVATTQTSYSTFLFKPALALRKELAVFPSKTRIKRDSTSRFQKKYYFQNDYFYKDAVDSLATKAVKGKYIILFPGGKKIRFEESFTNKRQQNRLYSYFQNKIDNDVGLLILEPAAEASYTALHNELEALYVKSMAKKSVADSMAVTTKEAKQFAVEGSGIFLNFGAAYSLKNSNNPRFIQANQVRSLQDEIVTSDTLQLLDGNVVVPSSFHFGIGIDKPEVGGIDKEGFDKTSVWSLGLDFSYTTWNEFAHFSKDASLSDNNTFRVALGGEIIPNIYGKLGRQGYFNRVIYRGGVHYETLPYLSAGNPVNEIGIDFGLSFPLGAFGIRSTPEYVNLNLGYAKRGNIDNNILSENYFKVSLSFTVNSRWFMRRKIGL